MYKEHEQLENIEENLVLWKYMDFLKFVNIITTKSIWFNRLDSFEDVFEGTYPRANEINHAKVYGDNKIPRTLYNDFEKYVKNNLYVLCLHNNEYESAAMWSLYAKDSGVAIKTNCKRVKNCFAPETRDIEMAKVSYIDYDKDFMPEGNLFYWGSHKRKSFEHENEIRCMYLNHKEIIKSKGIYIKVDVNELIEEIYISPYAPAYMKKTVEELLDNLSLGIPVIQSTLYQLNK